MRLLREALVILYLLTNCIQHGAPLVPKHQFVGHRVKKELNLVKRNRTSKKLDTTLENIANVNQNVIINVTDSIQRKTIQFNVNPWNSTKWVHGYTRNNHTEGTSLLNTERMGIPRENNLKLFSDNTYRDYTKRVSSPIAVTPKRTKRSNDILAYQDNDINITTAHAEQPDNFPYYNRPNASAGWKTYSTVEGAIPQYMLDLYRHYARNTTEPPHTDIVRSFINVYPQYGKS